MKKPLSVSIVLTIFVFFSIFGCSAGNRSSAPESSPLEHVPDVKIFPKGIQQMYSRSVTGMQKLGYVVTVSDPVTGLLTAERYMQFAVLEDKAESAGLNEKSSGDVFLTCLSILLVFGIVFLIVDAVSSDAQKNSSDHHDRSSSQKAHHDHSHSGSETPSAVTSYRYSISVRFTAMSDSATRVQTTISKVTITNGSPSGSMVIRSSVLLNELYRSLENEIFFLP